MKREIRAVVDSALFALYEIEKFHYEVEIPAPKFGDYSLNTAMKLAKKLKRNPIEIAEEISEELNDVSFIDEVIIVGAFINLKIKDEAFVASLNNISFKPFNKRNKRVLVEFGSINPTGPLHIGHGRNLVAGDVLSSLLSYAGYDVEREYYINDYGVQIDNLAKSFDLRLRELKGEDITMPEDAYHGSYVKEMAKDYVDGDRKDFAVNWSLNMIKATLKDLDINYDNWISERSLHKDGALDEALEHLKKRGLLYEKDGAKWFKTTDFGDDKDRVLVKSNGEVAYFASDLLYSKGKVDRAFDIYITLLGADHHGYIERFLATFKTYDCSSEIHVLLVQLAIFLKSGNEIKMSKRAGDFYTLEDLLKEIGRDACRMYFISRKTDNKMEFDIDKASLKSSENPVYYMQYAHARICSLLEKIDSAAKLDSISESEKSLIKHLFEFNDVIDTAARELDSYKLYNYALELASLFHSFYNSEKILGNKRELSKAAIAIKVQEALSELFKIFKISAPRKM